MGMAFGDFYGDFRFDQLLESWLIKEFVFLVEILAPSDPLSTLKSVLFVF
jgi:hypothetical protein